jgi:hypothetical protein
VLVLGVKLKKMTVLELKQIIESLPNDMVVILQKDAEGNGYSPLSCADTDCVYIPDSTWSGDVYDTKWTADDACMEDEEWKSVLEKPRALVLCPIN